MTTRDRPETGPMRFEGDWRGVFLRGDSACHYAAQLEAALDPRNGPEMRALFAEQLRPLVALLNGANEFVEAPGEQVLRPFAGCLPAEAAAPADAPEPLYTADDAALLFERVHECLPGVQFTVGIGPAELILYLPRGVKVGPHLTPTALFGANIRVVRTGPIAPAAGGAPR